MLSWQHPTGMYVIRFTVSDPGDFWPDPETGQNKYSAMFLLENFWAEICSKKYIHTLKI
jgi:hypothetical protein